MEDYTDNLPNTDGRYGAVRMDSTADVVEVLDTLQFMACSWEENGEVVVLAFPPCGCAFQVLVAPYGDTGAHTKCAP